ncbi:MAG: 4-(cytidine 5'-diphospho)-2-C-methyl-D-erythritol kinase [Pseudomonadota bacterium]
MVEITETAWAKINLALHVTGQREDGYHLIDSLVTFANFGDALSFRESDCDNFSMAGSFASFLPDNGDNLVVGARDYLRNKARELGVPAGPVSIHLEKNLPIASGMGGGSADAAACLRGLSSLWRINSQELDHDELVAQLGADIPMCLSSRPLLARGVGEKTTLIDWLMALPVVLVNPLVSVSTPDVFAALESKDNQSLHMETDTGSIIGQAGALHATRNDLQGPAQRLQPIIDEVISTMSDERPLLTRMTGSGATCFAIFETLEASHLAAASISDQYPEWWVRCGMTRTAE